jgi:CDP-diacylglycerol--glycerol-3-phosphate 3-phosphatidyltransferase
MNIPNILASFRIASAPFIFFLLVNAYTFEGIHYSWMFYFSGLLFAISAITDFFDGYIARYLNQETLIGAIIDQLADKMIILSSYLALAIISKANIWACFIILSREFLITGLRAISSQYDFYIRVSFVGKAKTVAQMFAIGFLIMDWYFATSLLWVAVVLTVYSGAEYLIDFKRGVNKI